MVEGICRPGGLQLTDRLLEMRHVPAGGGVLDVGCGSGLAVEHMRLSHSLDAVGLDMDAPAAEHVIKGRAEHLPFENGCMEGVFFECSLSQISEPDRALAEARRVLKHGGALYISDMFAHGEPMELNGIIGRLEKLDSIRNSITAAGFREHRLEDCSDLLPGYFAQLIFDRGSAAYDDLGADSEQLRRAKCGYYLAVYIKDDMLSPMHGWIAGLVETHRRNAVDKAPSWNGEDNDNNGRSQRATAVKAADNRPDSISADALNRWQLGMASQAVARAKQQSSFYRKLLSNVDTDSGAFDLSTLPLADADMLTGHGLEMLCVSQSEVSRIRTLPAGSAQPAEYTDASQFFTLSTSGTTGLSKRIYFTDKDLQRTVDFFSVGMRPLVDGGQRVGIMMSDTKPGSIADLLRRGLEAFGAEGIIAGNIFDYVQAAAVVGRCDCIVGMPAEVFRLCRLYPELRPRTVLLSADYIPESLIEAVEKIWACRVFTHYGLTETCYGLAVQCAARKGQHVRHADFIVEIIDPETCEPLPPGHRGEIVLTGLRNEAMPIIRYRTGDISELIAEPCACGCSLPRLGRVYGRRVNLMNRVNIHALDEIMYGLDILSYSAQWAYGSLRMAVEGGPVEIGFVQNSLGCAVQVEYTGECQLHGKGKRGLENCNMP